VWVGGWVDPTAVERWLVASLRINPPRGLRGPRPHAEPTRDAVGGPFSLKLLDSFVLCVCECYHIDWTWKMCEGGGVDRGSWEAGVHRYTLVLLHDRVPWPRVYPPPSS
jgi:hypothetical protein